MPRRDLIQIRRGTTAQWQAADAASEHDESRILAAGELGLDTETGSLKVGDGVRKFGDLVGYLDESSVRSSTGSTSGNQIEADFSTYRDGPLTGVAETSSGAALTWSSVNTGGAVPIIENGALTLPDGVSGTVRACLDLGAIPGRSHDINVIGMEVSFDPGATSGGALACMAITDGDIGGPFPRMPVHFVAATDAWSLDVVPTGARSVVGSGIGAAPPDGGNLIEDGSTRYRWEVYLDKGQGRAFVIDHRGNIFTAAHDAFRIPGKRLYVQVLRSNHATQLRARVHRIWADSRRVDRFHSVLATARATPPLSLRTLQSSVGFSDSFVSIDATSAAIPMPSSRSIQVTIRGRIEVAAPGDFFLAAMVSGAVRGGALRPVWAARGVGVFDVNESVVLTPTELDSGRVGDPVRLSIASLKNGGAATLVAGGYDKVDVSYQPLPFTP